MKKADEIYIIDSNSSARDALTSALFSARFSVISFSDRSGLMLEARRRRPSCILVDIMTAEFDNFEILRSLERQRHPVPVIALSADGTTIHAAVSAMKRGAYDVVQKHNVSQLVATIEAATAAWRPSKKPEPIDVHPTEPLTSREQQVLAKLLLGHTNNSVASELGLSPRTIEFHRSKIMRKFAAKSLTQILLKGVEADTDHSRDVGPTPKLNSRMLEATSDCSPSTWLS